MCVYRVGFLGEGNYKSKINGIQTKEYNTWRCMLQRCYSSKAQEKDPSYVGCSVCNEWHNFQNFAAWYEENYYEIPGQKMNLDKDILIKGNKIYSPDTCVFVPQNINILFVKCDTARGNLPIGVSYNKQKKKYKATCRANNQKKHLGYHSTPEEAFQAYKIFKENHIKEIADQYVDLIPQSLYDAMYSYEVDIDD